MSAEDTHIRLHMVTPLVVSRVVDVPATPGDCFRAVCDLVTVRSGACRDDELGRGHAHWRVVRMEYNHRVDLRPCGNAGRETVVEFVFERLPGVEGRTRLTQTVRIHAATELRRMYWQLRAPLDRRRYWLLLRTVQGRAIALVSQRLRRTTPLSFIT